jgi:hypothetical protein
MSRDDASTTAGARRRTAGGNPEDESHHPMRMLAAAALVAALPLASANAEIITLEYEGTLDGQYWPADVVITGTFTFNSAGTPLAPLADHGVEYPLVEHKMTLNGTNLFITSDGSLSIINDYLSPEPPGYLDALIMDSEFPDALFNGIDIFSFFLLQSTINEEPDGGPLTSLDPPHTLTTDTFNSSYGYLETAVGLVFIYLSRLEVLTDPVPLAARCDGFAPPFDVDVGLGKREQRVIPLRMELFDEDGFALGPDDITAPIVSVSYAVGGSSEDLSSLDDSPGNATPGNSFRWDAATERWAFNLSTRPYTAAGIYTVSAVAGEEYVFDSTCTGIFVRQ